MSSMASQVSIVFALSLLLGIASAIDFYREMAFSYSGLHGPKRWGHLDPTFSRCSSGKTQSPVNIQRNMTVLNKGLKPLDRNYKPSNATVINKGYGVGVLLDNAGNLSIDGKSYGLTQIHWHLPSEHRIDGQRFAAELHMVHKATDNATAVVAVLYQQHQENKADPLIRKITDALKHLGKEDSEVPAGILNLNELNRRSRKYYRYAGSLTTPPCTETVIWSILGKVMSISKDQIAVLDKPLNGDCKRNARPCQPLNGRGVELYDELAHVVF